MDENLSRIITAMIGIERTRRNDTLRAAQMGQLERLPPGHGRAFIGLDQLFADDYEARAAHWLTIVRRAFSEATVAWTPETAERANALLATELATDWDQLVKARVAALPGETVVPKGGRLDYARARAGALVRHEIELSVLAQDRTRIPVAEQLRAPRYAAIHDGWTKAHDFLRQTPPDYSNAAKESVGAVEQLARIITSSPTATLGDCIKTLQRTGGVQPPLLKGIEELWGWTSGEPGVRHGAGDITPAEAQYVLKLAEAALLLLLSLDVA
jgi:hypothetical protein